MRSEDLAYWLGLQHTPGMNPELLDGLLQQFHEPRAIFQASAADLEQAIGSQGTTLDALSRLPEQALCDATGAWLQQPQNHILTWQDPHYPALLRELRDAPLLLYVTGDVALLCEPQIAIVGSRKPSASGGETAQQFARALAQSGLTITSGMALGIDAAAHRGALAAGARTVAVAGTGLDRVYPAQHRELAHQISHHGALVSEFPLGAPPRREHFPRRNRIISGLSLGTLVVEAALRSGSLITARLAAEQGREVFAVPGSIHAPQSRGCHSLIRQGAKLVETVQDVFEELGSLAAWVEQASPAAASPAPAGKMHDLLPYLDYSPVSIDTLVDRSGLTAELISSMLLEMELQGLILSQPGGKYLLAPNQQRPM